MKTITAPMDASSIVTDQGSPFANFAYVATSGSTLVLDSNVVLMPALKTFEVSVTKEQKETELADGSVYPLAGGKTTATGKAVTIQNNGNAMKFSETHGGKYACLVYEANDVPINGQGQIRIVPYALMDPSRKFTKPGNEIEIGFKPAKSPQAITIDLTVMTSGFLNPSGAGTVVVPKGTYDMTHEYTIS